MDLEAIGEQMAARKAELMPGKSAKGSKGLGAVLGR
jgi:hypothetical protein